jgi:hypothetical protein
MDPNPGDPKTSGSATLESGMVFLSHRMFQVQISIGTPDGRWAKQYRCQ